MKRGIIWVFLCFVSTAYAQTESEIRAAIRELVAPLENLVDVNSDVAMLPFWNSNGNILPFSAFIHDELTIAWQKHPRIQLLDPSVVSQKTKAFGFTHEMTR